MTVVIGTDEAGYGPSLGPLVVAASAWRIAAGPEEAESALARAAAEADAAAAVARGGGPRRLWADSKRIYKSGGGIADLELAALSGVAIAGGGLPGSFAALAAATGPIAPAEEACGQWRSLAGLTLPLAAEADACRATAAAVGEILGRHGIALERIACRGIYAGEFNRLLASGLNKSDVLSAATLDLAADLRARHPDEPTVVWCDRHGGRKHYGGLLARHFDTPLVRPQEESPERSSYLLPAGPGGTPAAGRVEFCVGGEARIPVALASLAAKYVRELAMEVFNGFWSGLAPGLEPTAGYPTDAARWRREAETAIHGAGIAADDLWRRA